MRPQDIDKIANVVVNSLAGTGPGLLGCGAISATDQFVTFDQLECGTYECGGQAGFGCCAGYTCRESFFCFFTATFACQSSLLFTCPIGFGCEHVNYGVTNDLCGRD